MKIINILLLLCLVSCSHSPSKTSTSNTFETSLSTAINHNILYIKECLPQSFHQDELILYMNINGQGVISNITILPLTSRATQQCLSMALSRLRFKKTDSKSYKIRHVIKL